MTKAKPGTKEQVLPDTIPLFPLPEHVLFPGVPMPYHIFEPRYQAMIRELKSLDPADRWIAVSRLRAVRVDSGAGRPGFCEIATVGRVMDMLPVGGGRFDIVVEGIYRCRLEEVHSPHAYRLVKPIILEDADAEFCAKQGTKLPRFFKPIEQALITLVTLVGEQASQLLTIASSNASASIILYRLGAALLHDPDRRQRFLETRSIRERGHIMVDTLAGLLAVANRHTAYVGDGEKC